MFSAASFSSSSLLLPFPLYQIPQLVQLQRSFPPDQNIRVPEHALENPQVILQPLLEPHHLGLEPSRRFHFSPCREVGLFLLQLEDLGLQLLYLPFQYPQVEAIEPVFQVAPWRMVVELSLPDQCSTPEPGDVGPPVVEVRGVRLVSCWDLLPFL